MKKSNLLCKLFSLVLIFGIFFSSSHVFASSFAFSFGYAMGGTSYDEIYETIIDSNGNIITTGHFTGTTDFDPGVGTSNLTSAGSSDVFISKLDSSGNFVWVKQIGGTGSDGAKAMSLDSSGNMYITGSFAGTVDFDPGVGTSNLTSAGSSDVFISKLDSSGNFVWAKLIGGTGSDISYGIALDDSNNVYTTGYFAGTVDFDPGAGTSNLTSAGSIDVYVSKLDSSGNFVWAKRIGGTGSDISYGIALDDSNNVYTTGYFPGTVDFDPGVGTSNLTSAGNDDIFISKLDSSGNFVWVKQMGGTGYDSATSIAIDSSGNVLTTGKFQNTVDFDPGTGTSNLVSAGSYDVFISKLDSSGNFVWVKQIGGTGYDETFTVKVDSNDDIYTVGDFTDVVDFDPGAGTANLDGVSGDAFVLKLDSSGNYISAKDIGGTGFEYGFRVAIDTSFNIYVSGYFEEAFDADPGSGITTLTPPSAFSGDIFFLKLSPLSSPTVTSSHSSDTTTTITLTGNITNTGGESNTERGFNYGLGDGYGTNVTETGTYSTGTFSSTITGLNCGTTYYYRAYSVNSDGTGTSTGNTFTTASCPNSSGSKNKEKKESKPIEKEVILPPITLPTPTTTPTIPTCPITPTLKLNSISPSVKCLQIYLNTHNYPLTTTGPGSLNNETTKFGPLTKAAVIKFQLANNLTPDGIVGVRTQALLK